MSDHIAIHANAADGFTYVSEAVMPGPLALDTVASVSSRYLADGTIDHIEVRMVRDHTRGYYYDFRSESLGVIRR